MEAFTERTCALIGEEAVGRLAAANVLLFGLGGVGGHCAEALVRAGVGRLSVVDGDTVTESNLNRQLLALRSTIGRFKTEVFRERALDINPDCDVTAYSWFYGRGGAGELPFEAFDYVVDCIDDTAAKVRIIAEAKRAGVPVLTAMGAGNRTALPHFYVTELFDTSGDPLARSMRSKLRKAGISGGVKCVISGTPAEPHEGAVIGSISYVPGSAGLVAAGEVIRTLIDR